MANHNEDTIMSGWDGRGLVSTDWVAALCPSMTGWLYATRDRLLATAPPASAAAAGTCHGDLVLSHLLATDAGCTVIDLDLAHIGDRYRDLALFLAGLPADASTNLSRAWYQQPHSRILRST